MKNGYTNGRAKVIGTSAYANGTAYATSTTGSGTFYSTSSKKKKTSSSSKKSSSSSSSKKSSSRSSSRKYSGKARASGSARAKGSSKSSITKYLEKVANAVDWVEVALERASAATDRYIARAEHFSALTSILREYNAAMSSVAKSISYNEKAYSRYMSKANEVAKKSKMSSSLKSAVQTGRINSYTIREYSETNQKRITEYKKWYDKAQEAKQQVEELRRQQQELAETKLDKVLSYYDGYIDKLNTIAERYEAINSLNEALGSDTSSSRISNLNNQKNYLNQALSQLQTQKSKYQSEYNANKKYFTTEQHQSALKQIEEINNTIYETKTSIAELTNEIRSLELEKIEHATERFQQAADRLSDRISISETHGDYETEENKQSQILANNQIINSLQNEIKEIEKQMINYQADSTQYRDLRDKWNEKYSDLMDLQDENEQLRQDIIEIRFAASDRLITNRDIRIDENNQIMDMFDSDSLLDPDTGKITTQGLSKIALLSDNIKQAQMNQADLTEQKKALQDLYKSGQIGAESYTEKLQDLNERIRESATDINDYKNEILDLGKDNMQAEVDALVKVIDKRKEALNRKKEYYDYDKALKSQTKDLQALEAQRAALENVEGEAAAAQRAKLDAQIADAREALEDSKKDHQYNLEIQGYDDLTENLQESLDKQLKTLSSSLEAQAALIKKYLNDIQNSYSDVFKNITETVINSGLQPGMSSQYENEYNNSNGGTPLGNASHNQSINSSITENVANPDTSINGSTNASGTPIDSSNITSGNNVTITPPSETNRPIVSFTLSWSGGNLNYYASKTISVQNILPPDAANKSFSWSTSNKSIIHLSKTSGTSISIKGIKKGSASLTCKSTNGVSRSISVNVVYTKGQDYAVKHGLTPLNVADPNVRLSAYSNLNQYLLQKGFKALTNPDGLRTVGKKLGVITTKNSKKGGSMYLGKSKKYTYTQYNKILSALKKNGLRDGGIVDGMIPISKLNDVVRSNHDHGLATVRRDEVLLKPEIAESLRQTAKIAEQVTASMNLPTSSVLPIGTNEGFSTYYDALIKVESGGVIDKNVLNDVKAVAKQIYQEEQKKKLKEYHKMGMKSKF